MNIYSYEEAFGAWDKTTRAMREAIRDWFALYYRQTRNEKEDSCQRVAYTIVSKLSKTVFGEYSATAPEPFVKKVIAAMDKCRKEAVQLAMIGGECYLKPYPEGEGFGFTIIPRNRILIFGRNAAGIPTDVGTAEGSIRDRYYYTLLERRRLEAGELVLENRLYRSLSPDTLGSRVPLHTHPDYEALPERYRFPLDSVGLVQLKTPMANCVDGSGDGVSVYGAAAGLIRNIDQNEAQLSGEFDRGQSRILASADLLDKNPMGEPALTHNLFVGLDEDPEQVGITIFSPTLREQSYLARKQEYLRNVESVVGLKRGMLSDANMEDRTATEISASAGEYNLTVMDFQDMWQLALEQGIRLCAQLARIYDACTVPADLSYGVDWGNGVLYDEDKTWESYRQMVAEGLLKPEIALGWRFQMPADTLEAQAKIRSKFMPQTVPAGASE